MAGEGACNVATVDGLVAPEQMLNLRDPGVIEHGGGSCADDHGRAQRRLHRERWTV